jgi:hypothetical protein
MVALARELKAKGARVVYDVLDDWEAFSRLPGPKWYRKSAERRMLQIADKVTAVSPALVQKLGPDRVALSPNGVEWGLVAARVAERPPEDLAKGKGLLVGYIGSLSGSWHDWEVVIRVAQERPDWRIALIGPGIEQLPSDLTSLPNVHPLGPRPHNEIGRYIDAFDVGVIPFKQDALSQAVSPIKAYDYLARGCPVVSSPMTGLDGLPSVEVADDPADWVPRIEAQATARQERPLRWLWGNTWDARVSELVGGCLLSPAAQPVVEAMRTRFRNLHIRPDLTALRVHWQMAAACNYRCPYCSADWEFQRQGARWTVKQMQAAWERFNADHGPCQISVSGLEPMYGRKNLQVLTWLSKGNVLDIDTNFSFPLSALKAFPRPDRVFFSTSYHPSGGVSVPEFIEKVQAVRATGFGVGCASLVCYPPYLKYVAEWRRQFEAADIDFMPRPFYGEYRGRRFPQEYDAEEREVLRQHLSPQSLEFQLELRETRGRLCAAGWQYVLIQASGTVHRCPHGAGDLGGLNFYEDPIPLRDYPTVCTFDRCWCEDLWAYHLSDDERRAILAG